jgi:hypothetical protein
MANPHEFQSKPPTSEKHLLREVVGLAVVAGLAGIGYQVIKELGNDWEQGRVQQIGMHTRKRPTRGVDQFDIYRAANDV